MEKAFREANAEAVERLKLLNSGPQNAADAHAKCRTMKAFQHLIPRGPGLAGVWITERVGVRQFQGYYPGFGKLLPPDSHAVTYQGRGGVTRELAPARVLRFMWQRHKSMGSIDIITSTINGN